MSNDTKSAALSVEQKEEHKRLFTADVTAFCDGIESRSNGSGGVMSKAKYDEIMYVVTNKVTAADREKKHYKWKKEYVSIELFGSTLLCKRKDLSDASSELGVVDPTKVVRLCHRDELFEILHNAHVEIVGHAAVHKTYKCVCRKISNIPRAICELYVQTCPVCALNKRTLARPEDFKPILTAGFGRRGQCDLIDMQAYADEEYKWILHYQDHALKFSVLRALVAKSANIVAHELFMIFCLIGAPLILQTDNGKEFTAAVIIALQKLWPRMELINGRARHPQSQGSVEKGNQDVEKMIFAWMEENDSTRWSIGIHVVQSQKNVREHEGLNAVPYKLVFGQDQLVGLDAMHIGSATLAKINDLSEEVDPKIAQLLDEDRLSLLPEGHGSTVDEDRRNHPDISASFVANEIASKPCEEDRNDDDTLSDAGLHSTSPSRKRAQAAAFESLVKQGNKMKRLAGGRDGKPSEDLAAGSIVLLKVSRVDRASVDPRLLPGVVLDKNAHGLYLIGCKAGVLDTWYSRGALSLEQKKTPASYDLQEILANWRLESKRVSMRAAMASISPVGGQGHVHCKCKGKCLGKCKCRKKGFLCNSRCHKGSKACQNCFAEDDLAAADVSDNDVDDEANSDGDQCADSDGDRDSS